MNASIINLTSEPVGQGRERTCYVHPDYPTKLIKIPKPEIDTQTRREIVFYQKLQKRSKIEGMLVSYRRGNAVVMMMFMRIVRGGGGDGMMMRVMVVVMLLSEKQMNLL